MCKVKGILLPYLVGIINVIHDENSYLPISRMRCELGFLSKLITSLIMAI